MLFINMHFPTRTYFTRPVARGWRVAVSPSRDSPASRASRQFFLSITMASKDRATACVRFMRVGGSKEFGEFIKSFNTMSPNMWSAVSFHVVRNCGFAYVKLRCTFWQLPLMLIWQFESNWSITTLWSQYIPFTTRITNRLIFESTSKSNEK